MLHNSLKASSMKTHEWRSPPWLIQATIRQQLHERCHPQLPSCSQWTHRIVRNHNELLWGLLLQWINPQMLLLSNGLSPFFHLIPFPSKSWMRAVTGMSQISFSQHGGQPLSMYLCQFHWKVHRIEYLGLNRLRQIQVKWVSAYRTNQESSADPNTFIYTNIFFPSLNIWFPALP